VPIKHPGTIPQVTTDQTETTTTTPTPKSALRGYIEWVTVISLAIAISLLVRAYVFQTFEIPSGSMEPTLQVGDHIIVSKFSVDFGTIHRGDIIVFAASPAVAVACNDNIPDLVKRVIGLPGQTIYSKGNTIYINGRPIKQPWTHKEPLTPAIDKVTIPANNYFVIGDNQPGSCDSRYWGTVPRSSIIGKAIFRLWPPSRIGFL
jgi:signal peptidase I